MRIRLASVFLTASLITLPLVGLANKVVTLHYVSNPSNPTPCQLLGMRDISLKFNVTGVINPEQGLPSYVANSRTEIIPAPTFSSQGQTQLCAYFTETAASIRMGGRKYPLEWASLWTSVNKGKCDDTQYKASLRILLDNGKDCFIALQRQ